MFVVFSLMALFHKSGGDMLTGWLWVVPDLGFSWLLGYGIEYFLSRPADRWLRHSSKSQAIRSMTEQGLRKTIQWYLDNAAWWRGLRAQRYAGQRLGHAPIMEVT